MYSYTLSRSDGDTSISISPISLRSSLQKRLKTVCQVSGFKSVVFVTYATREPPQEPRLKPIGIPFDLHQVTSSDMNNINPDISILSKTRHSSLIASLKFWICSGVIAPSSIFDWKFLRMVSSNTALSSAAFPYSFGYLKLISSSNGSTESAIRFVFSIASRNTCSGNAP